MLSRVSLENQLGYILYYFVMQVCMIKYLICLFMLLCSVVMLEFIQIYVVCCVGDDRNVVDTVISCIINN